MRVPNVNKLQEFNAQFGILELTLLYNQLIALPPTPLVSIVADFINYLSSDYVVAGVSDKKLSRIINLRVEGRVKELLAEIDQMNIIRLRASVDIAKDMRYLLRIRNISQFNAILFVLYNYSLVIYRNSILYECRDEILANIIGKDLFAALCS